ncbi:hypothetical protein D8B26_000205 [Coccidioides posadasii str. Silveira]|uniref:Predicted protein n=2 Tax=Coccidioides posadasii TaxID=199306 RepID=E9D7Y8_COCPS|nr:hypothetical protein CPC735_065920 [Coccidioides posadasii C735 delta SOWgp]EER25493.1 hypothetical protein CPC735_065920 [Coccidioides posadasii C735 delta SOWgp]EFW17497.1 predicted protein [Coccidioides posadasii str. Silveira]QVM05498.1 hypothetical protein D8B26_000205 [Coccidioides posadasii str. Silveira]|eukprot:XP_003067638.1 hypothetical protein CPC735_065920 [Coccidioides posadasii C735 delta SOWgp]
MTIDAAVAASVKLHVRSEPGMATPAPPAGIERVTKRRIGADEEPTRFVGGNLAYDTERKARFAQTQHANTRQATKSASNPGFRPEILRLAMSYTRARTYSTPADILGVHFVPFKVPQASPDSADKKIRG